MQFVYNTPISQFDCVFDETEYFNEIHYTCLIDSKNVVLNQQYLGCYVACTINIVGNHKQNKTDESVTAICFSNCDIIRVPRGLTQYFPNLKVLHFRGSNLMELDWNDIAEYRNLEMFVCEGSRDISFIPENLFLNCKNLKIISFFMNTEIQNIQPGILNGLGNLTFVEFRGAYGCKYNLLYTTLPYTRGNVTLEELKANLNRNHISNSGQWDQIINFNSPKSIYYNNNPIGNYTITATVKTTRPQADSIISKSTYVPPMTRVKDQIKFNLNNPNNIYSDVLTFLNEDQTFKDFTIIIDDREFSVHKFILAARSPLMSEMLKNNPDAEHLKLVDISVEIFEIILKFLYTDELPNDEDNVNILHLFAAAGRLKIEQLKNFASLKILTLINAGNAVEVLGLSNKYEDEKLREKAFDKIKEKFPKILFKNEWATNTEKIAKIIDAFEEKEAEMRKIEEKFKQMMEDNDN